MTRFPSWLLLTALLVACPGPEPSDGDTTTGREPR